MALLTIPALVGPLAGPPLGGFITTYFSWHWIFLINVPVGIAGYILLAASTCRRWKPPMPPPVDITGFLLGGIAASGVVFGLSVDQPAGAAAASSVSPPSSIGLVRGSALRASTPGAIRHPILDLNLFQRQRLPRRHDRRHAVPHLASAPCPS